VFTGDAAAGAYLAVARSWSSRVDVDEKSAHNICGALLAAGTDAEGDEVYDIAADSAMAIAG